MTEGQNVLRLRIPELLEARGITAYELARRSDGRISMSAAYRLTKAKGRFRLVSAALVEALCDVLGVGPGDVFERDPRKRRAK